MILRALSRASVAVLLLATGLVVGTAPASAETPMTPDVYVNAPHWLSPRAHVSWAPDSEASGHDLRVSRSGSRSTERSPYTRPARLQDVDGTEWRLRLRAGTTLCVSVRARASDGTTTDWSPGGCWSRAYDTTRLRQRGDVTTVRDRKMWGGRGLVVRRRGRVVLADVPRGALVGFVLTEPQAGDRQRGYRLSACFGQSVVDVTQPGDATRRNRSTTLAEPQARGGCDVTYRRLRGTTSSFPLQAIWVYPRWLV